MSALTELIKKEEIKGAWLSGLGGAMSVELGYYALDDKEYRWKRLDQLLEIASLQGNVSWKDGEPVLHVHGTFSDENMQAFGGHVKELTVGGTCEVMLHALQQPLQRKQNEDTGLSLLDI